MEGGWGWCKAPCSKEFEGVRNTPVEVVEGGVWGANPPVLKSLGGEALFGSDLLWGGLGGESSYVAAS